MFYGNGLLIVVGRARWMREEEEGEVIWCGLLVVLWSKVTEREEVIWCM
jgi:hypothetical protein